MHEWSAPDPGISKAVGMSRRPIGVGLQPFRKRACYCRGPEIHLALQPWILYRAKPATLDSLGPGLRLWVYLKI